MTTHASPPPTPELERLTAVWDEYHAIANFLEWLSDHAEFHMVRSNHSHHWATDLWDIPECFGADPDCPGIIHPKHPDRPDRPNPDHRVDPRMPFLPTGETDRNNLILEYFQLDGAAISQEREAILRQAQEQAAAR